MISKSLFQCANPEEYQKNDDIENIMYQVIRSAIWSTVFVSFNFVSRRSSGGAALVGLHWTCVVVHCAFTESEKRKDKLWEKLVSILGATRYQSYVNIIDMTYSILDLSKSIIIWMAAAWNQHSPPRPPAKPKKSFFRSDVKHRNVQGIVRPFVYFRVSRIFHPLTFGISSNYSR